MRQLLTILLSFNLVSSFSQSSNPLIISNDGNYLLLFKDGPSGFSSTYFLEVIDSDSLYEYIERFILKEDTVFTLQRSYQEQRGYYYYENENKSGNVIFDTIMLSDLCGKYNMDLKNLIFPKTLQFKLDTIRYHKAISRDAAIYCNEEFDRADASATIKFNYHLIYKNIEIQNDTIEGPGDFILNSVKNKFSRIYVDEKHQLFFVDGVIDVDGCRISDDTYTIFTISFPMLLKVFGNVFW